MPIHEFKHCIGCGLHVSKLKAVVALPGPTYLCDECTVITASVFANEMKVESRIHFVDSMNAVLKGPTEIVAQWREAKAKKELEDEFAARG